MEKRKEKLRMMPLPSVGTQGRKSLEGVGREEPHLGPNPWARRRRPPAEVGGEGGPRRRDLVKR